MNLKNKFNKFYFKRKLKGLIANKKYYGAALLCEDNNYIGNAIKLYQKVDLTKAANLAEKNNLLTKAMYLKIKSRNFPSALSFISSPSNLSSSSSSPKSSVDRLIFACIDTKKEYVDNWNRGRKYNTVLEIVDHLILNNRFDLAKLILKADIEANNSELSKKKMKSLELNLSVPKMENKNNYSVNEVKQMFKEYIVNKDFYEKRLPKDVVNAITDYSYNPVLW